MNTNITAGTIARTACLALALTNQILTCFGVQVLPITDDQLNTLITTGLTVGTSVVNWWYNNSFTPAAIKADADLKVYRSADK